MSHPLQKSISRVTVRTTTTALACVFVLTLISTQPAQAQTYTVLHSFSGGGDGSFPSAGLTIDAAGNLYGTAYFGGNGNGTVFELVHRNSRWMFATLYIFQGGHDGALPGGRVIFGPDGSLYGNTVNGGGNTFGTVFNLKPPVRTCLQVFCPWMINIIHTFTDIGPTTGFAPMGDVVFDPAGNLYGTTSQGGNGNGMAYKLTPSNGSWTGTVLSFLPGAGVPFAGLTLDQAGNLYGAGYIPNSGTVYELTTPNWNLDLLHVFSFNVDGSDPFGGLIFDQSGNLYGGTLCGGANGEGTIYELSPSHGSWTRTTLYSFTTGDQNYCGGPYATLVMDSAGNLYGTTHSGGAYKFGSVFKLTHANGAWTYTSLHDFCAGGIPCTDGAYPFSNVIFDRQGNLYGTASYGGANSGEFSSGVVWKITP